MTKEQMREAVAKACGWYQCDYPHALARDTWHHPDSPNCQDGEYIDTEELPNYPEDLNACAEFEATLTDEQWYKYVAHLLGKPWWHAWTFAEIRALVTASPEKRCAAYLATMEGAK